MSKIKSNMTLISSRKKEWMKLSMPRGKQRIKNVVSVLLSPKRDWKNHEPKSSWPAGLSLVLPCSSLSPQWPKGWKPLQVSLREARAEEGRPPFYPGHAGTSSAEESWTWNQTRLHWMLAPSSRSLSFLRGRRCSNGTYNVYLYRLWPFHLLNSQRLWSPSWNTHWVSISPLGSVTTEPAFKLFVLLYEGPIIY